MNENYGSDFISITDEDGKEYELEVLQSVEYNGNTYLATLPTDEALAPEILIFKSIEEDGEPVLCFIEDEEELDAVNTLIMESLFEDSDEN